MRPVVIYSYSTPPPIHNGAFYSKCGRKNVYRLPNSDIKIHTLLKLH